MSSQNLESISNLAMKAVERSVANAFQTMLESECEIASPTQRAEVTEASAQVAGVISWLGAFSGTGILQCSPACACLIASSLLATEIDTLTEDALDAVAEMANIIFGSMKTELEEHLGPMGLGTPTVIQGNDIAVHSAGSNCSEVMVKLQKHPIRIRVYVAPSSNN